MTEIGLKRLKISITLASALFTTCRTFRNKGRPGIRASKSAWLNSDPITSFFPHLEEVDLEKLIQADVTS